MSTPGTSNSPPIPNQTRWFSQEVHLHEAHLKSYLRASFPSVRDVDDVVQESYVRVWKRQLLRPLTCARSFLFTVARNVAIDSLRRRRVSPVDAVADPADLPVADVRPDAAAAACGADELELLMEAIESLPRRCREVVILSKLHGYPPKEIAVRLGIAEGTVHLHGAKGLRKCEEFMRKRGYRPRGAS